ncbi:hypothetical protein [Cryobacterium lyxosi]|uniref:Uncharacterized protein n=1 Tax=Cryobacterium lyxosi TaxID=1259228 RepID=A0A4R8ZEG4_9MICO|nr:hypothetical protein [Cryobacterium lyxosi]TFD25870.1 hypothetical protein E3T27_08685 [Cryobacterium lyxosi]
MAERNRPLAMGPAQILAGSSNAFSVQPTAPTTAEPAALIGATVETRLAAELARLVADEITLDAFTPALQGYVLHGHRLALASLLPELTRAEQERDQANSSADRYYVAAFNPRKPIHIGPSYRELEKTRHEIYSGGAK